MNRMIVIEYLARGGDGGSSSLDSVVRRQN